MNLHLSKSRLNKKSVLQITGSKSESNRLLLLQAFYPNLLLENISNSDDSQLMTRSLKSNSSTIDIHHAGTAMRFLTAFYATQVGREVCLTGSSRMQERPIKILVDALNQLGADITYVNQDGFPPLLIKGKHLKKSKVVLKANISSQYISALLLIAPKLKHGLELTLEGDITSRPYIEMTLSLLKDIGVKSTFENQTIIVYPKSEIDTSHCIIESDWSSASYFYSLIALSEKGTQITLSAYKGESLQGDSVLAKIYEQFQVYTTFERTQIRLEKKEADIEKSLVNLDLSDSPDIAQTIAVTAFGLGLDCHLTGLHTLKIKETDRLVALKIELEKLGAQVNITDHSLILSSSREIHKECSIETYKDHRMAMAFAPLSLCVPLTINDAEVVSKSFPTFWKDLKSIGLTMEEK